MSERVARFVVSAKEAGSRLDHVVRAHLPELARRSLAALFADGSVRVDGRVGRKGDRARAGSEVVVSYVPDVAVANADLQLSVVAECSDWVAVDKPAGLASTARGGADAFNVASALLARYPAMGGFGYHAREAGLIHRLDTHTSGLLLAAKTAPAFTELRAALRAGRIHKRYLAVARPLPFLAGVIASELEPGRGPTVRVAELEHVPADALRAPPTAARVTRYRVLERGVRADLVEVEVSAAYRHQIRAHLAAVGSPILGDARYGSDLVFARHALHASALAYAGSALAARFDLESPLPSELRALLADA